MEPLSLRHILAVLSSLYGVPEYRESALKARFQHLQKIGFPAETKTGRGKPASYTAPAIVKVVMAFEFMACGLLPERAAAFASGMAQGWLSHASAHAGWCIINGKTDPSFDQYLVFDPNGLVLLTDPNDDPGSLAWHSSSFDREELANAIGHRDVDMVDRLPGVGTRHTAINLTRLLGATAAHIAANSEVSQQTFAEALEDWGRANEWCPDDD